MNTIAQWEKRLRPFFNSKLRIIGEIPLSNIDIEEMAQEVGSLIRSEGLTRATSKLTTEYPLTLLTLMSGFAALNTEQNYWQAFADLIGTDKSGLYNSGWHRHYVRLAKNRNLKVFDFQDDPTPYVTSIRFQGGIPTYSLPDYFERMVLPAVERPELREVNHKEALAYLLNHTYFVDSPVLDFLKNSGDLGLQFFSDSCKLMGQALKNNGEILSSSELDLPEYVIEAFEHWWEHREDARQHWCKPFIQAAPYSEDTAANLILPQQEIALELAARRLFWQIDYPESGILIERSCPASRSRQSIVTQEDFLQIPQEEHFIEVTISAEDAEDGQISNLRRWRLPFIPGDDTTPLIAFGSNKALLPIAHQFPADSLYLLIPKDTKLCSDGQARLVEESIPLVGNWQEWKMEYWDLSQAWSVWLERGDHQVGEVIPIQSKVLLPELVEGNPFQYQELDDPIYIAEPPSIRVPLGSGPSLKARLGSWKIKIRSLWEAKPSIDQTIHLHDHIEQVKEAEEYGVFSLVNLLGKQAAGIYEIHVFGPRGMDSDFRIRFWPKLTVLGLSSGHDPFGTNEQSSSFILRLQEDALCKAQPGFESVVIHQNLAGWEITTPSEFNRVKLDLVTPSDSGGFVRIPVSIPLPRLRWGLSTENYSGGLTWSRSLLHCSIDQILQAGNSSLHLEMAGLGNLFADLKVRLIEITDSAPLVQEARLLHTDFTPDYLRITLGQFGDTIRRVNSLARFELVYSPKSRDAQEICIPLLLLNRNLDISDVKLHPVDDTAWILAWREEHPLKNRRLMVQAVWQPWQKPWEYKIPDDARGEFLIENVALPPSRYQLYFYILPGYEPPLQESPLGVVPIIIDLCTPEERSSQLKCRGTNANEDFKCMIELAIIQDNLFDKKKRDLYFSEAARYLVHLTNLDLLTKTLKWMEDKDIEQPIKSFFFNKMFYPAIVIAMLDTYNPYDPSLIEYLHFTNKVKNISSESAKLLLTRIEDPLAIDICLKQLISKKDPDVLRIILEMMSEGRLSKRDAMNHLEKDPIWAIENAANFDSTPFCDALIASLLTKCIQNGMSFGELLLSIDWIARAIPYINNEKELAPMLFQLIYERHPRRFELLFQSFFDKKISADMIVLLVFLDLKEAIVFLRQYESIPSFEKLIKEFTDKYPELEGIVTSGSCLITPLGEAIIKNIEHSVNGQMVNARLGQGEIKYRTSIGWGAHRFCLIIDYVTMSLSVEGYKNLWKCGYCSFLHPEQREVSRHLNEKHRKQSQKLNFVPLPLAFTPDEISTHIDVEIAKDFKISLPHEILQNVEINKKYSS